MKEGSENKIKIIQIVKDTRHLFSKCVGVLFVYTIIFSLFREAVFLPVSRKMWSLSLLTVKEGYISDQNIISVFTHPFVLIAGLFAIVGYCIICLWETSGITMILEFSYRNQPVKLASILIESFKQITHCLRPNNWMIFVYLVVIQPIVDPDFAGQMVSDITIPEFIKDFIFARMLLSMLVLVVTIMLLVFFIRYLFIPVIMILEKKNFVMAAKKSVEYLKGRFISTYIKITIASTIGSLIFTIVPYVILYGLDIVLLVAYRNYEFVNDVGAYVFFDLFFVILSKLRTIFIKIFVSAMLLIVFHAFESQFNKETEIVLPKECIKTNGKIYTFKRFVYSVYAVIYALAIFLFISLTVTSERDLETVTNIISPTKVAAHKGYSSMAPENTLPSFELAANCDVVDYIELDVRETKDGVPVVIHDASILAATGKKMLIYDIDYDELQKLSATYGHEEDEFSNTRISSLDEVLMKYADKKNLIIEIKASDKTPELPRKIVELMEKYGITETSVIHSGNYNALKAVKEINPNIVCGFIIAVSTGGYEDLPYADFFSVEHTYLSSSVISRIHKRGKKVYVWTVNEQSSFDQVRNMGVDVLITDYPEDAYDGIHQYDGDLMTKAFDKFSEQSFANVDSFNNEQIDYNGTGD